MLILVVPVKSIALSKMNKNQKLFAIGAAALLLGIIGYSLMPTQEVEAEVPKDLSLPEKYMVFVEEPTSEEERMFTASLGAMAATNGYNPFFIIKNGKLSSHQMSTIRNLTYGEIPRFLFSNDEATAETLERQLSNVTVLDAEWFTLKRMQGFAGELTVSSYEEALWAAPVAKNTNKVIVEGETTFRTQEEAWDQLVALEIPPSYVVVANTNDHENITYLWTDRDGNTKSAYSHVPQLSILAGEFAAYHDAYVLTQWKNSTQEIGYMDTERNKEAIGIYLKLVQFSKNYQIPEYICLLGSGDAVPQFELPDHTSSDADSTEGDGCVSCDTMYGFLDDDPYTMDSAVGRIINMDLRECSNTIVRTFCYYDMIRSVTVNYQTGSEEMDWMSHASIWNGYEVADQRLQMTPGWFLRDDLNDEGFTYDYMRTTGNGGWASETSKREMDFKPVVESSGFMAYRGHGSWHATYYVYEPYEGDPQSKNRLEGNNSEIPAPSVVDYYLPPQVFVSVCCENGKIRGLTWWNDPIIWQETFAPNYFKAGGIGLISATEVSFSNLGQDIYAFIGKFTGDYQWDLNNCWYGFPIDGLLNHEEEHGTLGKAVQWAENRYIRNHDNVYSPFDEGTDAHWKEITMFACYGDPAFMPWVGVNNPGAGSYDPWHNGPDDQ